MIAQTSSSTYKGKDVKVKQVAEELGVRYVLEGSIRREGDEIRINAQLIDAMTGHHLWAERYDGTMGKIFALQDRITQKIVTALALKLSGSEKELVGKGDLPRDCLKKSPLTPLFQRGENYLRTSSKLQAKKIKK